jgi:SOS-response transcriptional repressor LexA
MRLTPRESQILSFVAHYIGETGRAPFQDQIAARFGLRSRTYVQKVLKRLEAKGLLKLTQYKIRGIEVIKQELRAAA